MTERGGFLALLGRALRRRSAPGVELPEPAAPPPEGALRVMTFNVRGSYHPDGENAWRRRAALNVRAIARQGPDVIGFQELQNGNARVYKRELAGYERVLGYPYENQSPHAYNAIFWDPERLELLDAGGFWLSETPESFSGSWETGQVRTANWARFRPVSGGPEFLHVNTHLDHVSGRARVEGSSLISRWLDGPEAAGAPVVLTGDFNCAPGSEAQGVFSGFSDAHAASGHGPANTFHAFQGEGYHGRGDDGARLDWILLRGGSRGERWEVHNYAILLDAEPPLYPSDHYPVVADLSLEGA